MVKMGRSFFLLVLVTSLVIAGGGCTKRAKIASAIKRADRYFNSGDYDSAEIEYIKALRLNQNNAYAFGRVGTIYLEEGRLARAYPWLVHASRMDTNNIEFREKLGWCYFGSGKLKEARDQAVYVLQRNPENESTPLLLVDASGTYNEMEVARQWLEKLNVQPAKRAPIETALANIYFKQHDFKAESEALARAKQADPKFGQLYTTLGIYYWYEKDFKQADEAFKTALTLLPVRHQARLIYAGFLMQTGNPDAARTLLEQTIQKAPDYQRALIALAELSGREKKYDEAFRWLNKLMTRDPDNYEALLMRGRLATAQGDPATAVSEYERLVKTYPKDSTANYFLGMAYASANDTAKAISSLNQAVLLTTNKFADATMALAQLRLSKGDFNTAIGSLRQLVQERPQLEKAQVLLAEAYRVQGSLNDAANIYLGLEKAYPTNAQTPVLLGNVYGQQNRNADARAQFNKSLELDPDYLPAYDQLTTLDIIENRFGDATQRIQKLMQRSPNQPEPSLLLARIYLAQNNLKQAADVLNKNIEAHPDFTLGYITLANAYVETNQLQAALEVANRLLEKQPDQPGGLMLQATIQDSLKNYEAARDAYEKVIAHDPRNSAALNNLAYLYSEHGELDKAYNLGVRAKDLLPYDPSTADTLGWICYQRGDFEQAASLLQQSAIALSAMPEVELHLGLARYMVGDESGARAPLQFAAQAPKEFSGKQDAKVCLSILAMDPKNVSDSMRAVLEKRMSEQPGDMIALKRLAELYKRDADGTKKAMALYEAAVKKYPKSVPALLGLARLYSANPDSAAKSYALLKTANKLAPDNLEVSRALGRAAYLNGDFKNALNLLAESSRRMPGDPELMFDLAEADYSEGRVDDAKAQMQAALKSGAAFSRAAEANRFLQLVSSADAPSVANAGSLADQVLKADPSYVPALMVKGALQEQKQDIAGATQTYQQALDRFPDFLQAMKHLAALYVSDPGKDTQTYSFAVRVHDAYPDDVDATRTLGIVAFRRNEYQRAASLLGSVASQRKQDAQAMFYLGMAQYKLRNKTESKRNLTTALNLKLPDKLAADAQRALNDLK